MLRSILVGLDGSPFSHAAVELGIRWAKEFDALLVGIGIVDAPSVLGPEPVLRAPGSPEPVDKHSRIDRELLREEYRKVERYLERFAASCAAAAVSCKLLEDVGSPAERIEVQAARFDLVLLGRRTFFNHGSSEKIDETLLRLARHAPRPLVTVPNSVREGKCTLVAYDGSPGAARALQVFESTGLAANREVHILTVGESHLQASAQAQRAIDFLLWHDIQAKVSVVVTSDHPASIIEQEMWNLDPGLLVMGAFGQGRLTEALFGSVTRKLLKQSSVPLFLYH
jgi:nucleotide-binding universal stress UspA family protein